MFFLLSSPHINIDLWLTRKKQYTFAKNVATTRLNGLENVLPAVHGTLLWSRL